MTLNQLKYILEIEKQGSINKAAANLFLSQPNLSKAVSDIEQELDIQVFRRTNRGVIPTEEGYRLIHQARSILEQCEDLKTITSNTKFSTLRVLSHRFDESQSAYMQTVEKLDPDSNYIFQYEILDSFEIIDQIYHQTADVGIIVMMMSVETDVKQLFSGKHLMFTKIVEVPYYLIIPESHQNLSDVKTLISKLRFETYAHTMETMHGNIFLSLFKKCFKFINYNKRIYFPSRDLQLDYISKNAAYGVGLKIDEAILNKFKLTQIPIPETYAQIGYLKSKTSLFSKDVQLYIDLLIKEVHRNHCPQN